MLKKVALYLRVSHDGQTVENQLRDLQEVAGRLHWEVVHIFRDEGISGARGREKRPGFDQLLRGINRRDFDLVASWSVDRLGRSLPDLVGFLNELQARNVDLYLHKQGVDSSTPSGRMLFGVLAVFSEFERAMIIHRVKAGLNRVRAQGVRLGRPPLPQDRADKIRRLLAAGHGVRATARKAGVSAATVQRLKNAMQASTAPPWD